MVIKTDNENVFYLKDKESAKTKTTKNTDEEKSGSTEGVPGIAKAILNMTMPRLFLILSMIIYGVIAYSKRTEGVKESDLSLFIFFILFILIVFIVLVVFKHLWNNFTDIFKRIEEFDKRDFKNYLKSRFLMLKLIILIFLIIILIAVIFNVQIIMDSITDFVRNFIEIFIKI